MFTEKENKLLYEAFELRMREKLENLPQEEQLERYSFSEKFEKRMQKLIKRQKRFYYGMVDSARKRAVAVAAVILACLIIATVSVGAIRERVVELIITVYEGFSIIDFDDGDEETNVAFKSVEPEYIPEGYEIVKRAPTEGVANSIIYENDSGGSIAYDQHNNEGGKPAVDNEGTEYREITVKQMDGIIFERYDHTILIFGSKDYVFMVAATLPEEEVLKIANSIPIE